MRLQVTVRMKSILLKMPNVHYKTGKEKKGFDPRFILKNLDVNTLWIFGTSDPAIPVDASLRVLKELDDVALILRY